MERKIKGITVEIDGDTTKLAKALDGVNKQSRAMQSELTKVEKLLKLDPKNTELVAQKQALLTNAIGSTTDKLNIMRQAQEKVNKAHEANAEWEKQYAPLKSAIDETRDKLKQLSAQQDDMDRALSSGKISTEEYQKFQATLQETTQKSKDLSAQERDLEKQFSDGHISDEQYRDFQRELIGTEQKLKSLQYQADLSESKIRKFAAGVTTAGKAISTVGDKTAGFGKALTAGVTVPIVAAGTAAVKTFKEVDAGADTVIEKTGATGEQAEELKKIYKDVADSVPDDFQAVGDAVGEINTRLEFTGDKLKMASEDFLKFSKINHVDVNTSVQLVSRAMGDAGIKSENYKSVLDALTVASQKSGISIDELTTNLAKYGAPMRALGLDTQTSIALFAGWEKAGVNTEIAFAGMKKAISNWGKAGKDSRTEFAKALADIKKAPNISKATTKAIEIFGAKAGPDLADAIKGGRFEIENYIKALKTSGGAVEKTYAGIVDGTDDAKKAVNQAKVALSEFGDEILKSAAPIIKDLSKGISSLSENYNNLTDSQKQSIIKTTAFVAAAGPVVTALGGIEKGVGSVFAVTGKTITAVKDFSTGIRGIAPAAGEAVSSAAKMGTMLAAIGGPGVLLALGAAAVAIGVVTAAIVTQKNPTQELIEKINEEKKSWDEMKKSADATAGTNLALINRDEDLWKELQKVTSANGKVKKGYEDRAKFILGELSKALGKEYTLNGNAINQYKDMQKEIKNIIDKKRAEILLDAHKAEYQKALEEVGKKEQEQLKTKVELLQAEQRQAEAKKKYNAAMIKGDRDAATQSFISMSNEQKNIKDLQGIYNGNESLLRDYYATIGTYEDASVASTQGNYKQVEKSLSSATVSFKTATSATKNELMQQAYNANVYAKEMRDKFDQHVKGVTQDMVDNAETAAKTANNEFLKVGNEAGKGITMGLDSQGYLVYTSGAKAGYKIVDCNTSRNM